MKKISNESYSVYVHVTPDKMYYVGISNNFYQRRQCKIYQGTALQPYIEKWGWENIESYIVKECKTKEEALHDEDALIQYFKLIGRCINKKRSGHCFLSDPKLYFRHWQKSNRDKWNKYQNEYQKERRRRLKEGQEA